MRIAFPLIIAALSLPLAMAGCAEHSATPAAQPAAPGHASAGHHHHPHGAAAVAVPVGPSVNTTPLPLSDLGLWNGRWRFSYFTLTKITPTTDAAAQANIGKVAEIDGTKVSYEGVDCVVKNVETKQVPTDEYLARYKLTGKDANFTETQLSIVKTDCSGTPFAEFIERRGELIVLVDGVLYNLRPEAEPDTAE